MAKTTEIDLSGDRLIALAADMVDNHNYIGALKMLNKNAELEGNDSDSLMLYAEIFDDMGLYEKSVNYWFRFMEYVEIESTDLCDCFEGLAVGFMNLGNEHFSAYYYNKLLTESAEMDGLSREDILKDFVSEDENPLKFAYPPELADCSDIINEGISRMKAGEYERASEEFEKVEEGNERYLAARNYIAMCKIITDKNEEAEQECLSILEKYPGNVQALTTLAAVRTEEGRTAEALELAEKLLSLNVENPDDRYKIATVCCENKLHGEAYKLFCKLTEELSYDLSLLYFKAVSAYNCGKYTESFEAFDRLLTVYPRAVTARYHYTKAREAYENGNVYELDYFYRLPQEVRESSLKLLAAYMKLSRKEARKLSAHLDITDCILWCFDESERGSDELKELGAQVAVKAEFDNLVQDILVNAFLPDQLKINVMTAIAERNQFDDFGVVVCNIFKRISFDELFIGRAKRTNFIKAYAKLIAHFSIIDDDYGRAFSQAAEDLYEEMSGLETLWMATKNRAALTAAIYLKSGIQCAGINEKNMYEFFETDEDSVRKIMGEL